jgi:hypothetical protein
LLDCFINEGPAERPFAHNVGYRMRAARRGRGLFGRARPRRALLDRNWRHCYSRVRWCLLGRRNDKLREIHQKETSADSPQKSEKVRSSLPAEGPPDRSIVRPSQSFLAQTRTNGLVPNLL